MIDTHNKTVDTKAPVVKIADETAAKTVTPAVAAPKEEVKVKAEVK